MPNTTTSSEIPVSKTREEIIKEAHRIEEALLYSSKGHFAAADIWKNLHLIIGIPIIILSAVASYLTSSNPSNQYIGIITVSITALSGLLTFLNPNEKSSAHLNAGNSYDALMNKVRLFRVVELWQDESDQVLTEKIKFLSEQKSNLNATSPQIPPPAYWLAKIGIKTGEGKYKVDSDL